MARTMVPTPAGDVCVETGTGSFKSVLEEKGRNLHLEIRADGLQHPIKAWLDKSNPALVEGLEKVRTEWAGRLAYRIDVSRATDVPADTPWADIPTVKKFRRLVAIRPELELMALIPAAGVPATVGAPADSASSAAPAAASAPAPAPAPSSQSQAPSGSGGRTATTAAAPTCVSCGESLVGRPVKKVPNGYVHTDTPCLERPFEDTEQTAGKVVSLDAGSDGISILEAGKAATAQRVAHRQASTADEVAAAAGMHRCQTCNLAVPVAELEAHEASPQHQGKARQAEQAAELAARRQRQVAQASAYDEAPHPVRPPAVPLPRRGPRVQEGKPYERFNSDGSVNMGSYAMQAAVSCVNWAQRLVIERVRTVAGETGEQAHIDPAQIRSLARNLLNISDRIQEAIRDDGHVDRMDNSHSRARSALAAALNVYPVPWGADDDVKAKWSDEVTAWAVLLVKMAEELDQ